MFTGSLLAHVSLDMSSNYVEKTNFGVLFWSLLIQTGKVSLNCTAGSRSIFAPGFRSSKYMRPNENVSGRNSFSCCNFHAAVKRERELGKGKQIVEEGERSISDFVALVLLLLSQIAK